MKVLEIMTRFYSSKQILCKKKKNNSTYHSRQFPANCSNFFQLGESQKFSFWSVIEEAVSVLADVIATKFRYWISRTLVSFVMCTKIPVYVQCARTIPWKFLFVYNFVVLNKGREKINFWNKLDEWKYARHMYKQFWNK